MANKCLGKGAYVHDPRQPQLANYLAAPVAPPSMNWSHYITGPWGMMLNDQLGDCTIACAGHLEMLWTAIAGTLFTPTDAQIETAYEAFGYVPGDPSTDQGAVISDVLAYWLKTGIAGHKIAAYAEVNIANLDELRLAIDLFGGVNIGVQLPLAAQNMGNHWTAPPAPTPTPKKKHHKRFWQNILDFFGSPVPTAPTGVADGTLTGQWAPGSWGGHCIPLVDYDATSFTCVSWDELITIDIGFLTAYMDEAWAVVSADIIGPSGTDVQGLNLTQLQADLALVK